jgi:hypothetical protein
MAFLAIPNSNEDGLSLEGSNYGYEQKNFFWVMERNFGINIDIYSIDSIFSIILAKSRLNLRRSLRNCSLYISACDKFHPQRWLFLELRGLGVRL